MISYRIYIVNEIRTQKSTAFGKTATLASCRESVERVDTLPRGNAVRSIIKDFRTALPTLAVPEKNLRLERVFFSTAAP